MKYIECPEVYDGPGRRLFLAGGISNCSDWQKEMSEMLDGEDLIVVNPRRKHFDVDDEEMEKNQIAWEFEELKKADIVSFWFTSETICPITLYELGKVSMTNKILLVGIHPEYTRRSDVKIQTGLIRPEVKIVCSIKELVQQVKTLNIGKKVE